METAAVNRVVGQIEDLGYAAIEGCLSNTDVASFLGSLSRSVLHSPSVVRKGTEIYAIRNLVELVPQTVDLLRSVRSVIAGVLGDEPRLVRALLFDETPRANWAVP